MHYLECNRPMKILHIILLMMFFVEVSYAASSSKTNAPISLTEEAITKEKPKKKRGEQIRKFWGWVLYILGFAIALGAIAFAIMTFVFGWWTLLVAWPILFLGVLMIFFGTDIIYFDNVALNWSGVYASLYGFWAMIAANVIGLVLFFLL